MEPTGEREHQGIVVNSLGNRFFAEGASVQAERYHRDALARRESLGNRRGIADSLNNLGLGAQANGDCATALQRFQQALVIHGRSIRGTI